MERSKLYFQHSLLYNLKKSTAKVYETLVKYYDKLHLIVTINFGFNALKVVILMLKTRSTQVSQKNLKIELQALLDENNTQMFKKLSEILNVNKSTISKRLHTV